MSTKNTNHIENSLRLISEDLKRCKVAQRGFAGACSLNPPIPESVRSYAKELKAAIRQLVYRITLLEDTADHLPDILEPEDQQPANGQAQGDSGQ